MKTIPHVFVHTCFRQAAERDILITEAAKLQQDIDDCLSAISERDATIDRLRACLPDMVNASVADVSAQLAQTRLQLHDANASRKIIHVYNENTTDIVHEHSRLRLYVCDGLHYHRMWVDLCVDM